jgi:hypothetical protein
VLKIKKDNSAEVDSHLKQLAVTAKTLNQLSDTLTQQVTGVEAPLNKLNLGVSAYVVVQRWSGENDDYGEVRLAYGKQAGKWGLAVEEITGNSYGNEQYESWPFKEAPRELRLQVIEAIPQLLEALVKKSAELTSEIKDKVAFAEQLTARFKANPTDKIAAPPTSGSPAENSPVGSKG